MIRHIVIFGFKQAAKPADIDRIVDAFAQLQQDIDLIKSFEWGVNVSPEGHDHGMTHVFNVAFANEADRDAYLVHPVHQAFVDGLDGMIEKVAVFDYAPSTGGSGSGTTR